MKKQLETGLAQLGITPPIGVVDRLADYANQLLEQNKVMNLTAITQPDQVVGLHFLDSAALLGCADLAGKSLIDVGTGAGFPGMVLKLLSPTLDLTLADSLAKRLDWLSQVADSLDMEVVKTLHCRAEELGQDPEHREQYDFATARAVSDLRMLSELCLPFVKVGGRFLAMKAAEYRHEMEDATAAIALLGGKVVGCYDYAIPGMDVERHVVLIEKVAPTPEKYPRRWAKMQKSPL